MASYFVPPVYAAFVWWFSTGAVLLLVGLSARFEVVRVLAAGALLFGALYGLTISANDPSVTGAVTAFTAAILLWGAQEIAFLAGWLTGPRPLPCPPDARGVHRLGFALAAILYHELALLACAVAVLVLTSGATNPIGVWTFAALWTLRQSAKINLFIGVPVTNDDMMVQPVQFLKTYFTRKPAGAFFAVSVTLSIAVLAIMVQRIVEVAATPFEIVGLALVATLFALGIVEHWFMLLPLPAITLWGWSMRPQLSREGTMGPDQVVLDFPSAASTDPDARPPEPRAACARQRLEDQFRQRFFEQAARNDLGPPALGADVAVTGNGRT